MLNTFDYGNDILVKAPHMVLGAPMLPPYPDTLDYVVFGMGCFWGAERKFWTQPGVHTTAVGYAGGTLKQPDYRSVCAGGSGHAEVVLVVFAAAQVSLDELLKVFWEGHNPTQGMRQGNDVGEQYRSVIFTYSDAHHQQALASRDRYQQQLDQHNQNALITTQIQTAPRFYYAEDYHQQYLAKNPGGYCGLGGTGVCFE